MHQIKQLVTSSLVIVIHSVNPDLIVSDDASVFEGKEDSQIQDIVFNELGAEQVDIYDLGPEGPINKRSFAIL